jgi:hypothetical protein
MCIAESVQGRLGVGHDDDGGKQVVLMVLTRLDTCFRPIIRFVACI